MNQFKDVLQPIARTTTLGGLPDLTRELPEDAGPTLSRGDSLGRYVVLGCIGTGGMGVVYAAHDGDLDRKVAIKLLRQGLFASDRGEAARRRVLREAQALARLAHPNVVAVHHTGLFKDQVFIVMELVDGMNLRQWARVETRSWREVLAVYRQAGQGLAAAHAAGLVHRDFKPGNAILGDDDRVRVLDFGLARSSPGRSANPAMTDFETVSAAATVPTAYAVDPAELASTPDAVRGTPAYMAPEQLAGQAADARSDQFSFCCALWEALHRELPFAGGTTDERREAMRLGEVVEPPAGTRTPGWLRRVIVRGLKVEPRQRYRSMDDLLAALARDPRSRRLRLAAAGVLLPALLAVAWWQSAERQTRWCRDGAETRLAEAWDGPRRERIHDAFQASGVSYAQASFNAVIRALDAHTGDWVEMRTDACCATHVRGEQSPELLDLRMSCLDERLREVTAAADLLERADAAVVRRAPEMASGLRSLQVCADARQLRALTAPPRDPDTAEKVEEVRARLAEAQALQLAGRYEDGLALARHAAAASDRLGYPPLAAEASFRKGYLEHLLGDYATAEKALLSAWKQAEIGRYAEIKIESLILLAWVATRRQEGLEQGLRQLDIADGAIRGSGGSTSLRNRWHSASAVIRREMGRYSEAEEHARQALEGGRALHGDEHLKVAGYRHSLATVLTRQGRNAEALEQLLETERIRRQALGEAHPSIGTIHQILGRTYLALGRFTKAEEHLQRSLGPLTETYGAGSWQAATVIHGLGVIDIQLGRYRQALARHRQALAIRRRLQNPLDPARSLNLIGLTLTRLGRHAEAEEHLAQALLIVEDVKGTADPTLAYYLITSGEIMMRTQRFAEAAARLRKAQALNTSQTVQGHVEVRLGWIDLETGAVAEAHQHLERAVEWIGPGELLEWADARFGLARTLRRLGREPHRALDLAREGRAGYLKLGAAGRGSLGEVDAWIERNGS